MNKKLVIITLIIILAATGLLIAAFLCTGTDCSPNIPYSKGPSGPPQVGTPNIPLPK